MTINVELENIKPGSSPIYVDDTNVTVTRLLGYEGDTFLGYEVVPLADLPGIDEAEGVSFFTAADAWLLETLAVRATMKTFALSCSRRGARVCCGCCRMGQADGSVGVYGACVRGVLAGFPQ